MSLEKINFESTDQSIDDYWHNHQLVKQSLEALYKYFVENKVSLEQEADIKQNINQARRNFDMMLTQIETEHQYDTEYIDFAKSLAKLRKFLINYLANNYIDKNDQVNIARKIQQTVDFLNKLAEQLVQNR